MNGLWQGPCQNTISWLVQVLMLKYTSTHLYIDIDILIYVYVLYVCIALQKNDMSYNESKKEIKSNNF